MRRGFFAGHEIPRIFFCTVSCWASVEEKQSAKGSEPDAGRAGTRSVLHTEFFHFHGELADAVASGSR